MTRCALAAASGTQESPIGSYHLTKKMTFHWFISIDETKKEKTNGMKKITIPKNKTNRKTMEGKENSFLLFFSFLFCTMIFPLLSYLNFSQFH